MAIQLTEEQKRAQSSTQNIYSWCVDDIIIKLKQVKGLKQELKAKIGTRSFKTVLFQEMMDKALTKIMNPSTTLLDYRFINDWNKAETKEEKEYLLKMESEVNPNLMVYILQSYMEIYVETCLDYQIPFDQEILTSYMSV